MESQRSNFKILLFPWLAHGHIFPYLELAKRILNNLNFHIFFCTTSINFTSITTFIQTNRLQESIELLELNLEPHPQLPPHYHTTKNLPSHLNLTLLKAFQTAKSSFSNIINDVKPHLVIYDAFQPWAATLASSLAVPAVHFSPFGAASVSFNHHYYTCFLNDDQFPFPEICLKGHERKSSDALFEFLYSDVFDQDKDIYFVNLKLSSEVVLLKANRGLEEKYIDYVSSASHKRILPVGPLVSDIANNEDDSDMILQWLSKKEQHSTVYISFGSEYFLSKQEIEEIAKGVELSGSNFIWIIRFPTMENTVVTINELLPEGFLERVKDRGMVLSGWAPQGSILRHPSTGAFLSHCGWSSLNESIYYGVPVIGMSMKLNMFIDAKMLVDAGGCVEVVRDAGRVYYKGEEIGKAIKEVMSGKRMRERELNT